ncbi:MAG: hypothetical protein L3K26_19520 [Candidatus Hydrogenedentes bacterium]|nr:hypothetical protein [Candidatus Hydrogenedentota bacterium]
MHRGNLLLAVLVCSIVAGQCAESAILEPVRIDVSEGPAEYINEYNLFTDIRRQIPNAGVVPYEINTPHFADYATLHRFLWLPEDTAIDYLPDGTLEFPLGAAVILSVGYPYDINRPDDGERLVETRLFVKGTEDWSAFQYQWNEDMTEARLALAGGKVPVSWTHYDGSPRSMDVLIPNINQCKMCHEIDGYFVPLGPTKARHLNREIPYAAGRENQLAHWIRKGYLRNAPEDLDAIPRTPVWNDPSTGTVAERARAYLDMNCASCHQPGGLAYTSGLDLTYAQDNPVRFGVFKAPVAAGRGVGKGRFGIEPGDSEASILFHRMKATDPGIRMPVVGRSLPHVEGLALIKEWIEAMDYPELRKNEEASEKYRIQRKASLSGGAGGG